MRIPPQTFELIKQFEGLSLKPYHGKADPPNVFTIGYGSIKYPPFYMEGKKVSLKDPVITKKQAEAFLQYEVEQKVKKCNIPEGLNDNQLSALISFAYNIGEGAFNGSTLLKRVKANPTDKRIHSEFLRWVNANGQFVPGLVNRREKESKLYYTQVYPV